MSKLKSIVLSMLLLAASCSAQIIGVGNRKVMHAASVVPSMVQSKSTVSGGATTVTLNGVVAGHAILVGAYDGATGVTFSFTDSNGDTFATPTQQVLATDGDTIAASCAIAGASGNVTITFKIGGTATALEGIVYEVANATCTQDATPVTFDSVTSNGATACSSNGPITTTTANDLLFAYCGLQHAESAGITAGTGWTNAQTYGNSVGTDGLGELQVAATPGSFTATSGTYGLPAEQATILIAYKP